MLSGMKPCIGLLLLLGYVLSDTELFAISVEQSKKRPRHLTVIVSETPVRKFPSDWYAEIGRAAKGDTFVYYGLTQSGWYQIQYGNRIGYIKAAHAKPIKSGPATPSPSRRMQPSGLQKMQPEETPAAALETEKSPIPELPEQKKFPYLWIAIGVVALLLYVVYFVRNIREQKRFEEYLRHKPS